MSKMDALRAMREARYAAATNRQAGAPAAERRPPRPAPAPRTAKPAEPAQAAAEQGDELCGHRSMNGRTCTREQGHAAKSHRYS